MFAFDEDFFNEKKKLNEFNKWVLSRKTQFIASVLIKRMINDLNSYVVHRIFADDVQIGAAS